MTDADRPAFAALMAQCAELFRNAKMSRPRLEAYFDALRDLSLEDIATSVRLHSRTGRFMPQPAELRALLPSAIPEPAEAWLEYTEYVRMKAPMSPLTRDCVRKLGNVRVLSAMPDHVAYRRFRELYEARRRQAIVDLGDPRGTRNISARLAAYVGQRALTVVDGGGPSDEVA